jgi:hypothetical protein
MKEQAIHRPEKSSDAEDVFDVYTKGVYTRSFYVPKKPGMRMPSDIPTDIRLRVRDPQKMKAALYGGVGGVLGSLITTAAFQLFT